MAIFSYTALDGKGVEQQAHIEAVDSRDATRLLREQGIYVLGIKEGEVKSASVGGPGRGRLKRFLQKLSPWQYMPVGAGDLIIFFRQIALMLRAGHPVVGALEASGDMVAKWRLRKAIDRMSESIRCGKSFSIAMMDEKKIFDPMVSKLIASGEQSGNLDAILDRLAESLERNRSLKRELIAALIYPAIVFLGGIGVSIFLIVGVIPRFTSFLTARGAALPPSTQILIDVSDWFQIWGLKVGIVGSVTIFLLLAAYTTRPGKKKIDRWLLFMPVVGKSISFASMAQAGWCLGMLLSSGVTALQSLRITGSVIDNMVIAECFDVASEGLLEGRNLSKAFEQYHIPLMMRHMAAVGESSGQLDTVMHDVGEYYQKELSARVKVMAVMIEPILILAVGGMVGFVYYAFFQAVMSVSTGGM